MLAGSPERIAIMRVLLLDKKSVPSVTHSSISDESIEVTTDRNYDLTPTALVSLVPRKRTRSYLTPDPIPTAENWLYIICAMQFCGV